MSLSETVRLSLNEEGWTRLDSASVTARGKINRIVRYMQGVVDEDVVVGLCKRLGICSTAFLFHDALRGWTDFMKEGEASKTFKTPYLWDDGCGNEHLSSCLHWLFLQVRAKQYNTRTLGRVSAEEYFVNLPVDRKDARSLHRERKWRRKYCIHYCTVGEMLYTAFVWRALMVARDNGFGLKRVNEPYLALDHPCDRSQIFTWQHDAIAHRDIVRKHEDAEAARHFSQLWGAKIGPQNTWREEWPTLLLSRANGDPQAVNRAAVVAFLNSDRFRPAQGMPDSSSDEAFNVLLQDAIPKFLLWLTDDASMDTVDLALDAVEAHARFPILPFYFWNALNQAPVCYSVIPVWTSQNHSLEVPNGWCFHLGLALSAVRPVEAWDWTMGDSDSPRLSQVDPLVLINVLRLMARPLVEFNLYSYLWKQLEKDDQQKLDTKVDARLKKMGAEDPRS